MNMRRLIWIGIPALVVVLAGAWFFAPKGVTIESVRRGPAVLGVYATGTVEPTVLIEVAPRVGALLKELLADEGAKVAEGQVLARLDDAEQRAAVLQAKVQEGEYEQELERISNLLSHRAISQDEYDKAKSRLDMARAARKAAEARLGYMVLSAPGPGTVIRRDGEVGEMIPANQVVFSLSGEEPLRVTAEVDEEDISEVEVGKRVLIRADAFPGEVFEGTVLQVTPRGDPIARSFRVRISLPDQSPFRVGMTAETNIIISERQDALLAPTSAIQGSSTGATTTGGWYVWVYKDGKVQRRVVKIGTRGDKDTEILSGLEEGDEVVVEGPSNLREGLSIRGHKRTT